MDSLEFMSAFALLSGMTSEEKVRCEFFPNIFIIHQYIHYLLIVLFYVIFYRDDNDDNNDF